MSVAIHFAAMVSESETTRVERPRPARKLFTWARRSFSPLSSVAARAKMPPAASWAMAMNRSAASAIFLMIVPFPVDRATVRVRTAPLRSEGKSRPQALRYPIVTPKVLPHPAETEGSLGRWPLPLLREGIGELGDPLVSRIQALRALRVEPEAFLIELYRLVEVERRVLEPVGDRLQALERGLDR